MGEKSKKPTIEYGVEDGILSKNPDAINLKDTKKRVKSKEIPRSDYVVTWIELSKIKTNPNNPRIIKDNKFKKLVKSIKEFPKMLEIRPIVVNSDFVVLGGNMRLKACREAGLKEVPIINADNLTDEEQKEFIIKDNVGFGEWDWNDLANEWDEDKLNDWGLDIDGEEIEDETEYNTAVESPVYEPKTIKPKIEDLYNKSRFYKLIDEIDNSDIEEDEKDFLKIAAYRHIVFDYGKIAEYYAHSDKKVQELMENSALVIIDYNKAIELGFVEIQNGLESLIDAHG